MPADRSRKKHFSPPKPSKAAPVQALVSDKFEEKRQYKEWWLKVTEPFSCPSPSTCTACKAEGMTTHCRLDECHFDGADADALADHLDKTHCTSDLYPGLRVCPFPGCKDAKNAPHHTMKQWRNLLAHIECILGNYRQRCRYCSARFPSPSSCKKHEETVHWQVYVPKSEVKKAKQASLAEVKVGRNPKTEQKATRGRPKQNAKHVDENVPDFPIAITRVTDDNYDDEPVAGPSSGPRYHALASGPSPAAHNYNAAPTSPGLASFPASNDDNWGPLIVPEELDLLLSRPPSAALQEPLVNPQYAILNQGAFDISPYEMAYLEANFGPQQYYPSYPYRSPYPMPYDVPIDPVLLHQSSPPRLAPLPTSYSTQPQQWATDIFGVPFPIGIPELGPASADSSQDLDDFTLDQSLYDGPADYDGGLPF